MRIICLFFVGLFLVGCSKETHISSEFILQKGAEITFNYQLATTFPIKELQIDLRNVPTAKTDRDFSDCMEIILFDDKGKQYKPEVIYDVNGSRKDIVAVFNSIPRSTKIVSTKIRALKDLSGSNIRWWTGRSL